MLPYRDKVDFVVTPAMSSCYDMKVNCDKHKNNFIQGVICTHLYVKLV